MWDKSVQILAIIVHSDISSRYVWYMHIYTERLCVCVCVRGETKAWKIMWESENVRSLSVCTHARTEWINEWVRILVMSNVRSVQKGFVCDLACSIVELFVGHFIMLKQNHCLENWIRLRRKNVWVLGEKLLKLLRALRHSNTIPTKHIHIYRYYACTYICRWILGTEILS